MGGVFSNPARLDITGSNIARKLIIKGNGNTLDLGDYYLAFTNANQSNGSAWDLTFDNVKINDNATSLNIYEGGFGAIYFGELSGSNAAADKVTFKDITANINGRPFFSGNDNEMDLTAPSPSQTLVIFEGTNNITNSEVEWGGAGTGLANNYGSTIDAGRVIIANGTTTFNTTTDKLDNVSNMKNVGNDIIRTGLADAVDGNGNVTQAAVSVANGAKLVLNGNSQNVRGIFVNDLRHGTVQIDGELDANMGSGRSSAIMAGNLTIDKTGIVNIKTQQDNNGAMSAAGAWDTFNGFHYAPIALGVGLPFAPNIAGTVSLIDNGTLNITRGNVKTITPLIAFGTGDTNGGTTYNVSVGDGATLDLQDGADQSGISGYNWGPAAYLGTQSDVDPEGIISLYGSSSTTNMSFGNVKYVNLQRTGKQFGTLIRLEGTTNSASVTAGPDNTSIIPLAQWNPYNDSVAPSWSWLINSMYSQNSWGDFSLDFIPQGKTTKDPLNASTYGKTFGESDGRVVMGPSQAGKGSGGYDNSPNLTNPAGDKGANYKTQYLKNFMDNFSWWKAQRISMGSALLNNPDIVKDADKYQPEAKPIDTTAGKSLSDLQVKDGIKDLIDQNGNVVPNGLDNIDWSKSHWFNSATDGSDPEAPKGNDVLTPAVDAQGKLIVPTTVNPNNPDNAATATITYTDGSHDFVNIPIVVTAHAQDSDVYTPQTKTNEVANGAPSIPAKNGISGYKDKDGNVVTTINGQTPTVAWDNTNNGMPVDPATGKPIDTNTPAIYDNVPVTVTYPDGTKDSNVKEQIVVGNVINVTNDPKHNTPGTVPEGYEQETFNVVNGQFGSGETKVIYDIKSGTASKDVVSQLGAKANAGYNQNSQSWNPELPTSFTENGSYTLTFGQNDNEAYQVTYKPQAVTGGDQVTATPNVTTKDGKGATLPEGSTYSFDNGQTTTTVDGTTVNIDSKTGDITFTAPTGDSATMNIPVKIAYPDKTTGDSKDTVYVVNGYPKSNPVINPSKPGDAIKGGDKLPGGTTSDWDPNNKPDPTKPGDQTPHVVVTIPGVDKPVNVPTTVHYPDRDASIYDVTYVPQAVVGDTKVTANPVITKDKARTTIPDGTKFDFENGTNITTIDGVKVTIDEVTGVITFTAPTDNSYTMNIPVVVTYPDGTAKDPDVDKTTATVYVVNGYTSGDKHEITPTPTDPEGKPSDGIKGLDNLPKGTTPSWDPNNKPVPSNPGDQTPHVVVTIPGVKNPVNVPTTVHYPETGKVTYPGDTKVKQGESTTITPNIPKGENPTFKPGDTSNLPNGVKVTVDPKTGDVTVSTTKDTPTGTINIPVDVTNNGKTDTVNIPVKVLPGDQTPSDQNPALDYIVINLMDGSFKKATASYPGSKGQVMTVSELTDKINKLMPEGYEIDPNYKLTDVTYPDVLNIPIVEKSASGNTGDNNNGNTDNNNPGNTNNGGNQGNNNTGNTNNGNQGGNTNTGDNGNNMNNNGNGNTENGNNTNGNNNANNGNGMNGNNGNGGEVINTNNGSNGMSNETMNNGNMNNANGMNTVNKNNTKKLPQTGESKSNAGIFGLALASLAGLFGLAGARKRHEDK